MALDVSPEVETAVREYAARAGLSIDELLARTFPVNHRLRPDARALALARTIRAWQREDATDDEEELDHRDADRAEHEARLDHYRHEAGMRPLFLHEPGED